jgi:hypothetical protein
MSGRNAAGRVGIEPAREEIGLHRLDSHRRAWIRR